MLTKGGITNPPTTTSAKPAEDEAYAVCFTEKLAMLLPLFQPAMRDAEEFWSPDKPPVVVLLGNLGGAFAAGFQTLSTGDKKAVAEWLEYGMKGGADDLGTAVATSFIEALVHKAEANGIWPEVEAVLGPLSQSFAAAYRNAPFHLAPA